MATGGAAGDDAAKQGKVAAKKKTPSRNNGWFRPEVDDEVIVERSAKKGPKKATAKKGKQ